MLKTINFTPLKFERKYEKYAYIKVHSGKPTGSY